MLCVTAWIQLRYIPMKPERTAHRTNTAPETIHCALQRPALTADRSTCSLPFSSKPTPQTWPYAVSSIVIQSRNVVRRAEYKCGVYQCLRQNSFTTTKNLSRLKCALMRGLRLPPRCNFKPSIIWGVKQRVLLVGYRRFGKIYLPHFQGRRSKDGTDVVLKKSATKYNIRCVISH